MADTGLTSWLLLEEGSSVIRLLHMARSVPPAVTRHAALPHLAVPKSIARISSHAPDSPVGGKCQASQAVLGVAQRQRHVSGPRLQVAKVGQPIFGDAELLFLRVIRLALSGAGPSACQVEPRRRGVGAEPEARTLRGARGLPAILCSVSICEARPCSRRGAMQQLSQ